MSTENRDHQIFFGGISLGNFHTQSNIGAADVRYSGFSLTASHNSRVDFNPETATLPQLANVVATLIMNLGEKRGS